MSNVLVVLVVAPENGKLDDYVVYLVNKLKEVAQNIVITVNGELDDIYLHVLTDYTKFICIRPNDGFDCGAYKYTLEQYLGWENIDRYDRLILMNDSVYGPLYSLQSVFDEMENRKYDFWGITEQPPIRAGNYSSIILPYHVQTYFITIERRMLHSIEFENYWRDVQVSNKYDETVRNFELTFTYYFNKRGFESGAYIDSNKFCKTIEESQAYIFMDSYRLISEQHCPFVKRKAFLFPHEIVLSSNEGETAYQTYKYISEATEYNEDLILQNLINKSNAYELAVLLHNKYCLPTEKRIEKSEIDKEKIWVYVVLTRKENCYLYFEYLDRIINCTNITIVTDEFDYDVNNWVKKRNNVELIIRKEKIDLWNEFVLCSEYKYSYEYIGFIHNIEMTPELDRLFLNNMISSRYYIENVVSILKKNKRMGVLSPPKPYFGKYFSDFESNNATYPYGNMFWCKKEIIKEIAIEKNEIRKNKFKEIVYIAKKLGYMIGTIFSEEDASVYLSNYHYMLEGIIRNVLLERGIEEFRQVRKINIYLLDFCEKHSKLYIYGAGEMGRECLAYLQRNGFKSNGFIVSDGKRKSNINNGDIIYELSELEEDNLYTGIIVAVSSSIIGKIEDILKKGKYEWSCFEEQ